MVILRDMIESDIADYVRWFTRETEWCDWDAPWEPVEGDAEEELKYWSAVFDRIRSLDVEAVRKRFEIEADGVHIGWVNWYTNLGYMDNPDESPVIGINIPSVMNRSRGSGTEALQQFMEYLRKQGYQSFYIQTWSGNQRMVRVAEKLGFEEVCRKKDYRQVSGKPYDAITWKL